MAASPYQTQPKQAFWRASVGSVHFAEMTDLWQPMALKKTDRVATAGSCFAQHIGHNLARRGANFMDMEPAPPVFSTPAEARRWGFGVFSCRYGNIYTSRQLVQLFDEAHGDRVPAEPVWETEGRFFDALRPGLDPVGQSRPEDVLTLRRLHLDKVRAMFATVDVFVFTMGLTEAWTLQSDGTFFPTAPGTIAGSFDPQRHAFHNLRHGEVLADMTGFRERLHRVNPGARILLTVSPVPLAATATAQHVLCATTYSKSVLRAVAGELAEDHADIAYFPSYEIISSHPTRGSFFEPDLRNVNEFGVNYVMTHFFSGALGREFGQRAPVAAPPVRQGLVCDEEKLDQA